MKNTFIETERLILRPLTLDDVEALHTILGDEQIMEHYPKAFDINQTKAWIQKNIERYSVFGFGLWAVVIKQNNVLIGDCGITMQNINGFIRPEIGYHIHKNYQRQGYAKEAGIACKNWIFKNSTFKKVYSYMNTANIASQATAKAIGMIKVDEYVDDGIDVSVYEIGND